MLTARLIVDLGIWMPVLAYRCLPLLVPYAVRDPGSRGNVTKGIPDQWGSPDEQGVFRDDNSLVKGIPRSLAIVSRRTVYRNAIMDKGFVAAHVWRKLDGGRLAARTRGIYSFLPNLVWLPADVAKLTDREGSFVQAFVQAIAVKIYGDVKLPASMASIVRPLWQLLPAPTGVPSQSLPKIEDLNFFDATPRWLKTRLRKIREVADALNCVVDGRPLTRKVISQRYTAGLPSVAAPNARALSDQLREYSSAVEEAIEEFADTSSSHGPAQVVPSARTSRS